MLQLDSDGSDGGKGRGRGKGGKGNIQGWEKKITPPEFGILTSCITLPVNRERVGRNQHLRIYPTSLPNIRMIPSIPPGDKYGPHQKKKPLPQTASFTARPAKQLHPLPPQKHHLSSLNTATWITESTLQAGDALVSLTSFFLSQLQVARQLTVE